MTIEIKSIEPVTRIVKPEIVSVDTVLNTVSVISITEVIVE